VSKLCLTASDDQNPTEHEQILSSSMLLLNLIPLIDVTFSTPTADFNSCEEQGTVLIRGERATNGKRSREEEA